MQYRLRLFQRGECVKVKFFAQADLELAKKERDKWTRNGKSNYYKARLEPSFPDPKVTL